MERVSPVITAAGSRPDAALPPKVNAEKDDTL